MKRYAVPPRSPGAKTVPEEADELLARLARCTRGKGPCDALVHWETCQERKP